MNPDNELLREVSGLERRDKWWLSGVMVGVLAVYILFAYVFFGLPT